MKDVSTKQALEMIAEAIGIILANAGLNEEVKETTDATPKKAVKAKEAVKQAVMEEAQPDIESEPEIQEEPASNEVITIEYLNANYKTYPQVKSFAAKMGVDAGGTKHDIVSRLIGLPIPTEEVEKPAKAKAKAKETEVKEAAPVKAKPVPSKPSHLTLVTPEPEEQAPDEVYDLVMGVVAEMDDDQLRAILDGSGISTSGKRESLIDKIVEGYRNEKIKFEDDGEAEKYVEGLNVEEVWSMIEAMDAEDQTKINDRTNPNMTPVRKETINAWAEQVVSEVNYGTTTVDDMLEYLAPFYNMTVEQFKEQYDTDNVLDITATYLDSTMKTINDEGEFAQSGEEADFYFINQENAMHCGFEMQFNEDKNLFICEACGAAFEAS